MISKAFSAIVILKTCRFKTLKLILVFIAMFNFGCTYTVTHAKGTIEVRFEEVSTSLFVSAFKEFSNELELNLIDYSREYPGGQIKIHFLHVTEDKKSVVSMISMDGKLFSVSAYENKKRDWRPLFDSCFVFLRERFPNARIEKN